MLKRLLLILALVAGQSAASQPLPVIEVYTPTVCLACIEWTEHLRQNGFTVKVTQTEDMDAVKRRLKVPKDLEAVPSATVAGYFIEGHVHADQIKELLTEKPKALGLAVPGLPLGAPGREFSSPTCETACTRYATCCNCCHNATRAGFSCLGCAFSDFCNFFTCMASAGHEHEKRSVPRSTDLFRRLTTCLLSARMKRRTRAGCSLTRHRQQALLAHAGCREHGHLAFQVEPAVCQQNAQKQAQRQDQLQKARQAGTRGLIYPRLSC